jgi:hypothetical protein
MHGIEARLEEDGSKPKRMRCATYDRLCAQIVGPEVRGQALWWPGTERLLSRLG